MILPTLALTLKGGGRHADMVIGLDLAFLPEAEKNFSWKKMHFKKSAEESVKERKTQRRSVKESAKERRRAQRILLIFKPLKKNCSLT